jgi:hypothetical protein
VTSESQRTAQQALEEEVVDYQLRSSYQLAPLPKVPRLGRRVPRKPSLDELDGMEKG